jgi:phosphoribosyl 1,2-cyclic phosphodiesterase
MRVRFWGTRGSLPVALTADDVRARMLQVLLRAGGRTFADAGAAAAWLDEQPFPLRGTFGGHSPCVQVSGGSDEYLLCDAGTGLRPFGNAALRARAGAPAAYNLLMSHLHWDHVMGFPLFSPLYVPGNRVRIHGCHVELEAAFRGQFAAPSFPVPWHALRADIEFVTLREGVPARIAGCTVTPALQLHGGDSYGYRIECAGRCVVYATDSEHKLEGEGDTARAVSLFRDADLVIFDAMYSLADAMSVKEDWGHSSNVVGVELCQLAGARRLVLFHHEPVSSDEQIAQVLDETRRFEALTRGAHAPLQVSAAWDGMEIEV